MEPGAAQKPPAATITMGAHTYPAVPPSTGSPGIAGAQMRLPVQSYDDTHLSFIPALPEKTRSQVSVTEPGPTSVMNDTFVLPPP